MSVWLPIVCGILGLSVLEGIYSKVRQAASLAVGLGEAIGWALTQMG